MILKRTLVVSAKNEDGNGIEIKAAFRSRYISDYALDRVRVDLANKISDVLRTLRDFSFDVTSISVKR